MKFFKQVFVVFLAMFMISCAADSKETVVSKKVISKTAPVSTRNQNETDETVSKGESQFAPTTTKANANKIAQPTNSSKPIRAKYSAGTANHLGGKLGGKLCKCLKNEDTNKCTEINQRINDVKQSMNPEIRTIFEKAFNATKEEC